MTADQGVKVSATPEERARRLHCALAPYFDHGVYEGLVEPCPDCKRLAAEIRSASEAARKAAFDEAAEWHEAVGQQKTDAANRRLVPQDSIRELRGQAHAHSDSASHFRSLSSRGPEREGRRE